MRNNGEHQQDDDGCPGSEEQVGDPGHDAVDPSAEVAGDKSERHAERQDDHDSDPTPSIVMRADQQPIQDVATELSVPSRWWRLGQCRPR